ncbi:MAG TPA: hypothetical protein PLG11_00910 [Bacteroidales bacterium]|jgi:hypothetical protein|nr:MAG: hypothetical protein BWX51_00345 [Bacteroidetes bacterium ADurb.Bin012]HNQ59174.1 hypothetical protein [Bacteroidales bacterium]HNV16398.1 hypothetical protein [Bacteroidales bacterium]HNZ78985.1 hypothetical protein [Bacteroidales bacterium]HOH90097.1 hypothetical protein [Bacteroidales bacterium]
MFLGKLKAWVENTKYKQMVIGDGGIKNEKELFLYFFFFFLLAYFPVSLA